MRKLLWLTLGFGGACLLCAYLLWNSAVAIPALLIALAGILFLSLGAKRKKLRPVGLILLGCAAAFGWFTLYRTAYLSPLRQLDGETRTITVYAGEASEKSLYGSQVSGWTRIDGKPYRIRLYLKKDRTLEAGDRLTADVLLRLTLPGGKKENRYHSGNGLFLLGTQKSEGAVDSSGRRGFFLLPGKIASLLKKTIAACLPEEGVPFAQALLLGDTEGLDYETDLALKLSGIRHAVAVSGLHVGILYGIIRMLTLRKRWLTAMIGLPTLLFFAAMAGFTPSVSRACLMAGLMMLGDVFLKSYDAPTALSFGTGMLLLANPLSAASVSLQLSVASVSGILLVYPVWKGWYGKKTEKFPKRGFRGRLVRWLGDSVGISLSAMLFTTPISALYFGAVSIISPLTNLLTLWCVELIFCGTALLCVIGLIFQPAGILVGQLLMLPIHYVLGTARLLSRFPLAAVYTRSAFVDIWLCLTGVLCVLLFWRKKHIWKYGAVCVLSLAAALFCSWWFPRQDDFRATVLDVGQGQSILLQSRGHSVLVDCGGGSAATAANTAAEELLSQGIRNLESVVLTHPDQDHVNGVPYLLERISVGQVLVCGDEAEYANISPEAKICSVSETRSISLGSGEITLYPPEEGASNNDNCICVLFTSDNYAILITGDRRKSGEKALLASEAIPDVDILVVGHHGSKTSTSQELLDAVKPEIAVVSAGKNNAFGHPTEAVLERLSKMHCTVYRTDRDGTVTFRR